MLCIPLPGWKLLMEIQHPFNFISCPCLVCYHSRALSGYNKGSAVLKQFPLHSNSLQVKSVYRKELAVSKRRSLHSDSSQDNSGYTKESTVSGQASVLSNSLQVTNGYTKESAVSRRRSLHKTPIFCNISTGAVAVTAIIFLLYYLWPRQSHQQLHTSEDNITYLEQKILKKYSSQPKHIIASFFDTIGYIKNGTEKKDSNAVITILYSDKETAECIVKDFAIYAATVFYKNKDYTTLNGSSFDKNFSLGCEKFKKSVEKNGVLVVYNFQDIPADKVKLFHGICDRYTPYVNSKAVYLILLQIDAKQKGISKKMEKVRSRVMDLWSGLEGYILQPLITRLVEGLIIEINQGK